jgi:hypothetical protein
MDESMRELTTDIDIGARPSRVWEVLMDFGAYPSWNPFIRRIAGSPAVGSRLEVTMEPPGGKPMRFTPNVLALRPNREFRWKGRLFFPGLFDGEHVFEIEPVGTGRSRFVQRERFSGILVPFLWKTLDTKTRRGFVAMNRALKARSERSDR